MSSTNTAKPKISCETKDVVKRETFKWSINNVTMRLNGRAKNCSSAVFTSDAKIDGNARFELKWQLVLGIHDTPKLPCILTIMEDLFPKESSIVTFYEVSILNSTEKKIDNNQRPSSKIELITGKELLDKKNNLLPDDTLTILFEVSTVIKSSTTYKRIHFDLPKPSIYKELLKLLNDDEESFSDLVIEVDGAELKAHKVILAAHSPVFSVMLKNKSMKEAQNNRIIIKDMDLEVAKQMLEFIYTNKQPSRINEFANELMAAAHKYEMDRLRVMCEEILFNNITTDNAVKTLIYANMCGAETLKEAIINFIKNNPSLLKSVEFKQLEKEISSLCFEVFQKMLLE